MRTLLATAVFWLVLAGSLTVSGCGSNFDWRLFQIDTRPEPRPLIPGEVLAAQTRRTQVIASITRLQWVLRHTRVEINRLSIEEALADRRAELVRLDAIIAGVR